MVRNCTFYARVSIVTPVKGNMHARVQNFTAEVLSWNNNLDKAAEVDDALHLVLQMLSSKLQLEAAAVCSDHGADKPGGHYQLFGVVLVIFFFLLLLEPTCSSARCKIRML